MTTAFHLPPLRLAQLALRVHPEALRVYAEAYTLDCAEAYTLDCAEAYTLDCAKTYRIGFDDIADLPTEFWLDICAEDANGHSRVVIPVMESRAMLPHMAAVCEAANLYIASGAAFRHNAYAATERAKRKKLREHNTD